MSYDDLHQALFLYSLTLPRLMACFIFLPILNKQTLGGTLVRNGVLCSLALFIFPMINQQDLPAETDGIWLMVILGKEVLLGMLIGFVAAIPFWAIEAAGFLVITNVVLRWQVCLIPLSALSQLQRLCY